MNKRNISQVDIGNHVGKPKATVNSWIKRDVIPDGEITLAISELLGVSVKYLITGESTEDNQSEVRRRFQQWIDGMSDEEMIAIEDLFEVLGKMGQELKK